MNYEQLKQIVIKHSHLYYDSSAPEISDAEWDKLYDKLDAVETAQGWRDSDSPTLKVGGKAGKVKHPFKLYSLRKEYELENIEKDYDIITPKIDGANLSLIYKQGKLKLALTRGDGEMGENVTHLALEIVNIPKKINTEVELLVINGECLTDKPVDNYRNYISGALGLKSAAEFKEREIIFVAHDSFGYEMNYTTRMSILTNMGFFTVLDEKAKDYPQDGLVYRINDYKKCVKLGYTSKYPRFAVALKQRESETAITTLQEVVWVIGRTGTVNPTGIITPVVIDDATISRVTLHNISIIEQHNLGLGDTIEIERAGGVIPKFLRVKEHSKHGIKITQSHAENSVGTKTKRDGPRLLVSDKNNINTTKVLEHFIKTIDIKGLGPANIKKMGLAHPVDLFANNNWDKLGAIGPNIEAEIERAKTKPYELVLASLGINGVGRTASKLIISKIPNFKRLRDIATVDIKGIGPSTIDSILSWLDENEDWVYTLPLKLEQNVTVEDIVGTSARKICITGKTDMTRGELTSTLEAKGFKVTSTVTKDCYALITAGDTSSSKYKKAVDLGIKIVDYWSSKKEVLVGDF